MSVEEIQQRAAMLRQQKAAAESKDGFIQVTLSLLLPLFLPACQIRSPESHRLPIFMFVFLFFIGRRRRPSPPPPLTAAAAGRVGGGGAHQVAGARQGGAQHPARHRHCGGHLRLPAGHQLAADGAEQAVLMWAAAGGCGRLQRRVPPTANRRPACLSRHHRSGFVGGPFSQRELYA